MTNGNQVQTYERGALPLTKRLSHHWMMRGNFTVSNWTSGGNDGLANPTDFLGSGNRHGEQVVIQSANSGAKIWRPFL